MFASLSRVFWNRDERRLRALWRLAACAVMAMGLAVVGTLVPGGDWFGFDNYVSASLGVLAGLALAWRFLDRRPLRAFGFAATRQWWRDLAFGLGLGAALMALIFLVLLLGGWLSVTAFHAPWAWTGPMLLSLGKSLVLCVMVSLLEESLDRGYLLQNLAEGLCGRRIGPAPALVLAAVLSSVWFGLCHLANPSANALSTFNIAFAGLFLALPRMLTGSLAIPLGVHLTWNYFQGPVFGFQVSGMDLGARLFEIEVAGPPLWTGGAFGPEAGLLDPFTSVVGIAAVLLYLRHRDGGLRLRLDLACYAAPQPSIPAESPPPIPTESPAPPAGSGTSF
jgi:membrane protease YdiL (CAAX protease family)